MLYVGVKKLLEIQYRRNHYVARLTNQYAIQGMHQNRCQNPEALVLSFLKQAIIIQYLTKILKKKAKKKVLPASI